MQAERGFPLHVAIFFPEAESLRGPFRGFLFRVPDRFSGFGSRVYDSGFISSLKLKGFGVSGFWRRHLSTGCRNEVLDCYKKHLQHRSSRK